MKLTPISAHNKRGFTLIELMVVIAILAALGGIAYPTIMNQRNAGPRQVAQSNLKTVHTLLFQFQEDYGQFPCDATAEEIMDDKDKAEYDFGTITGNFSNNYFRQFFYNASNSSEAPFEAEVSCDGFIARKGDDNIARGKALNRGENGIAYVMRKDSENENGKKSVARNATNAPLAMTSVFPSKTPYNGDEFAIDISSFMNHFFIVKADGSISDLEDDIREDDNEESKGYLKQDVDIFPKKKRSGDSTASNYLILSPDL